MSLREEMWKYEQITGESAEHVPIIKLGAFLDGYEMGLKASDQQPKKGKWNVFDAQNYCITYICSECGRLVTVYHEFGKPKDVIEMFPFCHCGADMREVIDE